ncbi:hypothetical protein B0T21DRAFT_200654 [Apiosordaria backusii]|uniref:Uncharacterized protein n=1 Tax=Apiosordaria backusii TaxID=314023 RepID=A0AA40BEG1_9PEZI|nr:hypothetical protein B0T21DRAFT_200654 [Apiosordaria backusii]
MIHSPLITSTSFTHSLTHRLRVNPISYTAHSDLVSRKDPVSVHGRGPFDSHYPPKQHRAQQLAYGAYPNIPFILMTRRWPALQQKKETWSQAGLPQAGHFLFAPPRALAKACLGQKPTPSGNKLAGGLQVSNAKRKPQSSFMVFPLDNHRMSNLISAADAKAVEGFWAYVLICLCVSGKMQSAASPVACSLLLRCARKRGKCAPVPRVCVFSANISTTCKKPKRSSGCRGEEDYVPFPGNVN